MRLSPTLRTLCAAALMTTAVAVIEQAPANAVSRDPIQGIQLGHTVDVGSCARHPNVDLFLNNADLVARTGWLRIDLRAAGSNAGCDPATAYQSILDEVATRSEGRIQVIGLLSNDFMWGHGLTVSPQAFAAAAGDVACNKAEYAQVDAWEVWNEPTWDNTKLEPDIYAQILGHASQAIRACGNGDEVISGGINPQGVPPSTVPDPVNYLNEVSAALAANRYGGHASFTAAIDGIGGHPYVTPIGETDTGHQPVLDFAWRLYDVFRKPVYVTEVGWSVHEMSADLQCLNLVEALKALRDRPDSQVMAAIWFTFHDFGDSQRQMGLLDDNHLERPALRGYTVEDCGGAADGASDGVNLTWTSRYSAAAGREAQPGVGAVSYEVLLTRLPNIFYSLRRTTTTNSLNLYSFDPPLEPGTYLWRVITLVNGRRIPSVSWSFAYLGVPAAPSGQTATPTGPTTVAVSWRDNSNNEANFQLTNGVSVVLLPAGLTSYTWTGIAPNTYMCFSVRAVNVYGESAWTPYACTTTPQAPPAAPTLPRAAPSTGTSILVSWTDNSGNETGFEVNNGTTTVRVPANTTSHTWGGLANGANVCFRIRAVNSGGASAYTTQACAATPTIPAAPTGQTATPVNGSSIRVTWADRSGNEIGFEISNGTTSQVVGANSTAYTWAGLANGTYMCFRVRSYSLAGYSAWTPYACTTTPTVPAAPIGQTAVPASANSINVAWADRSGNETGFQIYDGVNYFTVGAGVTTFTRTGLAAGTYMCFAIRSFNAAGYSAWTPYACTTTPTAPVAPANQTATALSTSQIRVNWADRSGNETGFQIYDGVSYFTVGANVTSFTRTGLASRTWMCFAIRSYNAAGYSAWTPYACTYSL